GTYPDCTAVITPVTSSSGTAVITLSLRDVAGSKASVSFNLQIRNSFAIGQPQLTSRVQYENGMGATEASVIASGRLYVTDTENNRVLGYNKVPTTSGQAPSFALGQPNLFSISANNGGLSSSLMWRPTGIFSDGIRLFVSDSNNNRVLVWNTLPTTSGQPADFVLGQPNMTSNTANNGGLSASTLAGPYNIHSDGSRLYVVDNSNHRILVWNSIPTSSGQPASFALGQPDLTSNTANNGGISGSSLRAPWGVFSDGTSLFVSDDGNHRVLVWGTIPTSSGQVANLVLGQPNFLSATANNGGLGAGTLSNPRGIYREGSKLYIADAGNSRILVWNSVPIASGQNADLALGQPNLTSNTQNNGGLSGSSLKWPQGVYGHEGKIYVLDSLNYRILVWTSSPTVSGQGANFVLGQPTFTTNIKNYSGDLSKTFSSGSFGGSISTIYCDGTRMFVVDTLNHRVLVWNAIPSRSGQAPDIALGQPDLVSNTQNNGGVSASSMYSPRGVFSDGVKLYVADTYNNRVLVWNTIPTTSGQPANVALGQANLTNNSAATTAAGMSLPISVYHNGSKLFVADSLNNRVLVWNTIPTVSGSAADYALGQPNLTTGTQNTGGLSASTMYNPYAVISVGTKLLVSDYSNSRVLVWTSIPTASGQSASFALGQPDLTSNTQNNGGRSAATLGVPYFLFSDGTKLFVPDGGNHRVLVWSTMPSASGQAATSVIGQPDFTSNTANNGGFSPTSLDSPISVFGNASNLFIADSKNDRVVVQPMP
ncbi:MAG: NHL repeat-containing protein, partial [Proteobacteria bacterium]|nr:NHL repeat-containing protein [Pseudomonadota bacterium]